MRRILRTTWLLALCALFLLPPLVGAQDAPQTLTVQLGPDTGQNQGVVLAGDSDWGYRFDGRARLPFGNYTGPQTGQPVSCRSFLYFPLDDLPRQAQVQSALLELYVDDWPFAGSGSLGVYRVQAAWTEPFDWAAQPLAETTAIAAQTLTASEGWVSWDVAPLVQSWADGAPNYGLMLAAAPQPEAEIGWAAAARGRLAEGDPALLPRLTIVYELAQAAPPIVPEPSTLLLLTGAVSTLALYAGWQIKTRRPPT